MAYQITITISNGYRCGCCQRDWDSTEWADTLEEALAYAPVTLIDGDPHPFNGDLEIKSVSVVDGATGEEIANGSALWSHGYGRYSGYNYTRWMGYRPDSGGFETLYSRDFKLVEETWDVIKGRLDTERAAKDRTKAEKDLADAQARLAKLGSPDPSTEQGLVEHPTTNLEAPKPCIPSPSRHPTASRCPP